MIKRWIITAGLVLTAIALALAGAKASKKRSNATRKDATAVRLMNSGISREIKRGKKLRDAANRDKDAAIVADARMTRLLNNMGTANENLDAVADRFNSRRLRQRAGRSAT